MNIQRAMQPQRGAALIVALFLIVVVAALGVFALRIGINQSQAASLSLLEARAESAAHAGLEYWSRRVHANSSLPCAPTNVPLSSLTGFQGFTVTVDCQRIASGTGFVYEVTARARHGSFGQPDFVQREAFRRVTNLGAQAW